MKIFTILLSFAVIQDYYFGIIRDGATWYHITPTSFEETVYGVRVVGSIETKFIDTPPYSYGFELSLTKRGLVWYIMRQVFVLPPV